MKSIVKRLLRPGYRLLARNPLSRAVLRREVRAMDASAWFDCLADDFVEWPYGAAYGVSGQERQRLVAAFQRNTACIESGTSPAVHIMLAREILNIPPEPPGCVVECGAWKGACSASLSLLCQRIGRRLQVCDSFQGLPDDGLRRHVGLHTGVYGHYREGMFCGTLEEVRANIARYGALDVCDFIEGFFSESLGRIEDRVAFAFLDVDLESSTRDCLKALWPRLIDHGLLYSDDAGDLEVVRVYFDESWWQAELGCSAPGFVGSGCGLPLGPAYSSIGYTRKLGASEPSQWRTAPFLYYPETPGEAAP